MVPQRFIVFLKEYMVSFTLWQMYYIGTWICIVDYEIRDREMFNVF